MLPFANIFQPLINVFEAVLKFFHNSWGIQWGWAIVLLTIVVRAILLPLTVKQFHSMRQLQIHGPELKLIQQKYKDDKTRQQEEVMKFYKENNVNPFGSCLPMVAQLPVFISLFYMLRQSLRPDICPRTQATYRIQYMIQHHVSAAVAHAQTTPCGPNNGANFLFIKDLTNKESGIALIVLLVLYVGSQLASSLIMQTPTMDRTQRLVMLGIPFVFVFVVINFPAGVLVYWITTNLWTIGQQLVIKRRLGPLPTAAVAASGATAASSRAAPARPRSAAKAVEDGGKAKSSADGATAKSDAARAKDGAAPVEDQKSAGGIGKMLRDRVKGEEDPAPAARTQRQRGAQPPPPPRKRKKRSGRRR
ncbi:MAG: YidC/Oxa1 family membrane protein insertase [Solirubrobacteraceae bacterium]